MRFGWIRSPRRKRDVSWEVCFRPTSSRSSAARFCSALGPAADARLRGAPPGLLPLRLLLDIFQPRLVVASELGLVCRDDRGACLRGIVRQEHEIEVAG